MPNTFPNTTSREEFEKIQIASKNSFANFHLCLAGQMTHEIKKLDHKEVAGIKLLGSSTGKMLIDNQDSIENIFNNTSLPISVIGGRTNNKRQY